MTKEELKALVAEFDKNVSFYEWNGRNQHCSNYNIALCALWELLNRHKEIDEDFDFILSHSNHEYFNCLRELYNDIDDFVGELRLHGPKYIETLFINRHPELSSGTTL